MPSQEQDTLQDMSRHQQDTSRYSLSAEETSSLFVAAGVPRSPRTIIRHCSQGHLDCIKIDTERNEKYLILQEPVDLRIQELQQILLSSRVESQRDMSGQFQIGRDTSRQDETRRDVASEDERGEVEKKIKSTTHRDA